jgi:hypothetical protein
MNVRILLGFLFLFTGVLFDQKLHPFFTVFQFVEQAHVTWQLLCHRAYLRGFAVFAARLKLAAVGAPGAPGFLIFSPLPAAMRARFLWMLA